MIDGEEGMINEDEIVQVNEPDTGGGNNHQTNIPGQVESMGPTLENTVPVENNSDDITTIDNEMRDDDSDIDNGSTATPAGDDNEDSITGDDADEETIDEHTQEPRQYNLRAWNNKDYRHMQRYGEVQLARLQKEWVNKTIENTNSKSLNIKTRDLYRKTVSLTFKKIERDDKYAQVSVTKGIRRHGGKAIEAVLKEYTQLNNKDVLDVCNAKSLSRDDKRNALNLITMIKEKRNCRTSGAVGI